MNINKIKHIIIRNMLNGSAQNIYVYNLLIVNAIEQFNLLIFFFLEIAKSYYDYILKTFLLVLGKCYNDMA